MSGRQSGVARVLSRVLSRVLYSGVHSGVRLSVLLGALGARWDRVSGYVLSDCDVSPAWVLEPRCAVYIVSCVALVTWPAGRSIGLVSRPPVICTVVLAWVVRMQCTDLF